MMFKSSRLSWAAVALLTAGLATGTFVPLLTLTPSPVSAAPEEAQGEEASFPDIQGHWAQPFIESLAEQDIVTGYLDGTYRPERPVARDEYAAMIRQAFDQEQERSLDNGSAYNDVPEGYWAAPAIEEAYEMGFMTGYPGGFFRPEQQLSRAEALMVLARNLNLDESTETAAEPSPQGTVIQPAPRQTAIRPIAFPLAITALMQPLFGAPARAETAADPAPPTPIDPGAQEDVAAAEPTPEDAQAGAPLESVTVSNYYADADAIPQYAVDPIAEATRAGIVVNYPDPQVLNPNQPATRGDAAAFVHQALVNLGRLEPIPSDVPAANYIVEQAE